jgi:hypothetical protein
MLRRPLGISLRVAQFAAFRALLRVKGDKDVDFARLLRCNIDASQSYHRLRAAEGDFDGSGI